MSDEPCQCLICRMGRTLIEYAKDQGAYDEATGQAALNVGEMAQALVFLMNTAASGMTKDADVFWLAMAMNVFEGMGRDNPRPGPTTCH